MPEWKDQKLHYRLIIVLLNSKIQYFVFYKLKRCVNSFFMLPKKPVFVLEGGNGFHPKRIIAVNSQIVISCNFDDNSTTSLDHT